MSSSDYDQIDASQSSGYTLSDGETWENKLIDLGNGETFTISATGSNWTIRNIGFTGTFHHNTHEYLMGIADTGGGTSTIENVYFEDGDPNAGGDERGGCMWVSPDHNGTLNVTNVNFNIGGALGIYGSAPGSNSGGGRGTIHIDGCYAFNCHHTAYRVTDNGDSVRNSTVVTDGSRTAARAFWIWESPDGGNVCTLENINFDLSGGTVDIDTKDNPTIDSTNLQYGSSPVPDGCPTTPLEAASGEGGGGGGGGGSDPGDDEEPAEGLVASGSATHTDLDGGGYGFALWSDAGSVADARFDALRVADATAPTDPDDDRFVPGHAEDSYDHVIFLLNETGTPIEYDLYVERNLVQNDIDSAEWDKSVSFTTTDHYERVRGEVPDGTAHSYFFDGDLLAAWASAEFSWSGLDRDGNWSPADEPDEPDIDLDKPIMIDVDAPNSVDAGDTVEYVVEVTNHSGEDRQIDVELFIDGLLEN